MPTRLFCSQYEVTEWPIHAGVKYSDPFNEVELDVLVTHETGQSWRIPAFWAGGDEWRARFSPPAAGRYQASPHFSDGHSAQTIEIVSESYRGSHRLLKHGPILASPDRRSLQFSDGAPFFWLGDTWWMALCRRIQWPEQFQRLAALRAAQGFSVVQIVAGLYPDMPGFDPRGANEAGFPWEEGYSRINPAYFDMADLKIAWLVKSGLIPCIVGCWGYYLPILGIEKMKQHWRTLVARWGAYPVVWCLAGEAAMPYYLSPDKPGDEQAQIHGWTELARYVREIDPYRRMITIHPTSVGREQVLDASLIDLNMLQTGHDGYRSVPNSVAKVTQEIHREPVLPVLVAEANYEGIIHGTDAEAQRLTFWSTVLSGGCGYTYGANGLWQLNNPGEPYGASPWGGTWGGPTWEEAAHQPGAAQLGLAKQLLERYPWQKFEPHPEWVDPAGSEANVDLPFAAGIPGEVRIIYFYWPTFPINNQHYTVKALEPGIAYRAFFWDPRNGREYDLGLISPDEAGGWTIPVQPELKDWVVVIERSSA